MNLKHPTSTFGVIGHPVDHSLSPFIHKAFAKQWATNLDYQAFEIEPNQLVASLAKLALHETYGLNVTLPHKQAVLPLCHSHSERAKRAQAVNTLTLKDGAWHGDNTDGAGLVNDLTQRHGIDLRSRRTLLLGSGGAAFGIAPALLDAGIAELMISNRTANKVDLLIDALGQPNHVHSRYWEDLGLLGHFDLIINATSAGRGPEALKLPFNLCADHTVCVDLSYGRSAIDFLAWAQASGSSNVLDGLGMLVEQAAESFYVWQGVRPETDDIYTQLRHLADGVGASE
jgi:shikimate dehydrogenase